VNHSKVFLKVEAATDEGKKPLPGFVSKTLEFTAGDGQICDALECALVWRDRNTYDRLFNLKSGGFECLQDVLFKLVCAKINDSSSPSGYIGMHRDGAFDH